MLPEILNTPIRLEVGARANENRENRKPETENPVILPEDHKPREHCGVCGIFGHPDAAKLTYFGLYALQHRGQERAPALPSPMALGS